MLVVKKSPANAEDIRDVGWSDLLEEGMASHSVFSPGESHGQRSLVGYSPLGHKELDMTEQLAISLIYLYINTHFSNFIYICHFTSSLLCSTLHFLYSLMLIQQL